MKKMMVAAALGIVAAGAVVMVPGLSATTVDAVQMPAPKVPAQKQNAPVEKNAMAVARAEREAARRIRAIRALASHKNRAPGERAHRRWRKRRSAGKAA